MDRGQRGTETTRRCVAARSLRRVSLLISIGCMLLNIPSVEGLESDQRKGSEKTKEAKEAPARTVLVVDHEKRTAYLEARPKKPVRHGEEVRVASTSAPVVVRVENTNTVLYKFEVKGMEVEAQEIKALRGFLKALGPYFLEAARHEAPPLGEMFRMPEAHRARELDEPRRRLAEELNAIREELRSINNSVFGSDGLLNTELRALETLAAMRRALATGLPETSGCRARKLVSPGYETECLAENLQRDLSGRFETSDENARDSCGRSFVRYFEIRAMARLREALKALPVRVPIAIELMAKVVDDARRLRRENVLEDAPFKEISSELEAAERVLAEAKKALGDAEGLLTAGQGVEALARKTMDARSSWCPGDAAVDLKGFEAHHQDSARTGNRSGSSRGASCVGASGDRAPRLARASSAGARNASL